MKLNRLTILNFQKIADLDMDLSQSKIHLFAGLNEAGKSTIRDAIRFCMLGDSDRVELKKDYKRLVNRTGRKGLVTVQTGDMDPVTRDVASGKTETDMSLPEEARTSLDIAIGSQSFVDLKLEDRARFLYRLTDVRTDADEIVARMKKREVAEGVIEELRPLFRRSIESAHKKCKDELTRRRAQWQQIAGEVYGVKKGVDWAPLPPSKDFDEDTDLEAMKADIDVAQAVVNDFNQQLGSAQQQVEERARLLASEERLKNYVNNLPTLKADLDSLTLELEGGTVKGQLRTGYREELATLEELISKAERAQHVLTCPGCGMALKLGDDHELEFMESNEVNFQKTEEELAEKRADAAELRIKIAQHEAQIKDITKKVTVAQNSTEVQQNLASAMAKLAKPEEIALVRQNLAEAQEELDKKRATYEVIASYQNKLERNEKDKQDAQRIHQEILQWTIAEEAMAPNGIQQDLLGEALLKINSRMKASARAVGWKAPSITPDMEIEREGGDVYGLLSESARWRVGVIVAEAISAMSGVNMLILDRMDVLDPDARVPFMKWIVSLASSYDSILIMATMKQRPTGLPKEVEVHWIENGKEIAA